MKSTNYSEKVLDHFRNPRNVGTLEGENIASGRVGNPVCGDIMEIYLDIDDADETIKEIKFQTFGCGSAVATSSMITEMAKGMKLDDAMKITRQDVANELEGLPPVKMHCSNLAADALQAAIKNYREKQHHLLHQKTQETSTKVEEGRNDIGSEEKQRYLNPLGQINVIKNEIQYLGSGVSYGINNIEDYKNKRVLVVFKGENAVEIALELTSITGRVILLTEYENLQEILPEKGPILKRSDVKVLGQSRLLEVMGEGDVEKVKIFDLDEENTYELFIDHVIIPEKIEITTSCDLPDDE